MKHLSAGQRGELLVLLGALLWSTGGVSIKLLSGEYGALAISASRSGLCALLFFGLLRGRVLPRRRESLLVAAGSVIYAAVVTLFVIANQLTTAANAILLQYAAPLWVALAAWLFAGRRPALRQWGALGIGFAGIALCAWPGLTLLATWGPSSGLTGDAAGLLSGVAFAALIVLIRRMNRAHSREPAGAEPALVCLVWGNGLAFAIGLPSLASSLFGDAAPGLEGRDAAVMLWLGFAQLGGGYYFFQRGVRSTPALTASLLSFVEPVFNPVWVALVVGEVPAVTTWAGGALVLASVAITFTAPRPRGAPPQHSGEAD